ncbi:hypothetical protein BTVI_139429 [Pitangus sulphuratus]|nr:hypothetical protein BTVI_139429 [Pitangus sulphuratus]
MDNSSKLDENQFTMQKQQDEQCFERFSSRQEARWSYGSNLPVLVDETNEWNKNDDRLLLAVENGDPEKVASLLGKKGASATKQDSEGKTAFHLAATKGHAECLRIMVTHGADVTAQDGAGYMKTFSVAFMFIQAINPLNFTGVADGNIPLLLAVQSGHTEVCKYLLDHGADINTRDKNGRTALMMACEVGNLNMVDAFLRRGAHVSLVDVFGQNALHYAKLSENTGIQNLLSSKLSQDVDTKSPTKAKQERTPKEGDSAVESYSTQTEFEQTVDRQNEFLAQEPEPTLNATQTQEKLTSPREVKMRYLQEDLKDVQRKLENSEARRRHLETQAQSRIPETDHLNSPDISENGSGLNLKFQETQNRYEEAGKDTLNVQRQKKLSLVSSESEETSSGLSMLKVAYAEVETLKQELKKALEENEKQKEKVRELQKKFEDREQNVASKLSVEECEEMKNSYCSVIENINQEKALLIERYKEGQEEIKRLQDKLTKQTQLESSAEAGGMKDVMHRMVDELNRQLSELSQLYKEAQTELEDYRKKKTLDDTALDYIPREEHEKLMEVTNSLKYKAENELSEMQSQYTKVLDEAEELKQLLDTQKQNSVPLTEHRQVIGALRNTIKEMEEEINELKKQLNNKEGELRNLEKELLEEKTAINEAMVPKAAYEKLQSSLEGEVGVLSSKLKDVIREKENVSLDALKLRNEILHLKEAKEGMHTLLEAKEREVTDLQQKYHQVQEALLEMKNSSKLEEDKDKKINEMSKEISKLKEALNSLSQLSYSNSTPKRQSQQLEVLQQQVKQLQNQLTGQMDEDVQKVLKQILSMCKSQSQKK